VKGDYYACGEIVSILLQITTDDTFSQSSSDEFSIELFLRDGETLNSVVINCDACETECSDNGAMVEPTFTYYEDEFNEIIYVLQFSGLTQNTNTVIRLDIVIECNLDCGCSCDVQPDDKTTCVCPASTTPRRTHLSETRKRHQQQSESHPKWIVGIDPYQVALLINDYYINDDYYTFPVLDVLFADGTLCEIVSCDDYTGCFTGSVSGKIGNSYKDRTCDFAEVSCDDGDEETYDRCIPPSQPNDEPNMPPNCIHTGWDETLDAYCYYLNQGYDCEYSCMSDDDCDVDGTCYESSDCSVIALQEENLESADSSKQQSIGSLSPLQLIGIIGGCVGFVVMVVFVVVIYKKFYHEKSMSGDAIASLQVPLN